MRKKLLVKKLSVALLAAVLCLSLAACGGSGSNTGSGASGSSENTEASEDSESPAGSEDGEVTSVSGNSEDAAGTSMTAGGSNGEAGAQQAQEDEVKRVARDGADIQTEDKTMSTRVPMEGGTKINMYFGDTVIPGVLNDSETAKALIEKLPITQHVSRYSHDFCGVTEDLPYKEEDVHYGWLNGDIDYATDAPYFTILFEDEDDSEQYGYQVNIGVITCPLSEIAELEGSFDVRIELAEE